MALRDFPRELIVALRTTPTAITVVGIGSLAILLLKILRWNYMPEVFLHAHVLGDFVQEVLAATFAAYLFFVISFQVPLVIERRRVAGSFVGLGYLAASDVEAIYVTMREAEHTDGALDQVTLEMVTERFQRTSPGDPSRLLDTATMTSLPWLQALIGYRERFCESIQKVWRYSRFIDPDFAALLDGIELSTFARTMRRLKELSPEKMALTLASPTLEIWAEPYFKCYQAARALRRYCDQYKRLYGLSR